MIGLESTFEEHMDSLLAVFREVHRVLRDDGLFFLNYSDSYAQTHARGFWGNQGDTSTGPHGREVPFRDTSSLALKPKDLIQMPARLAIACQAEGWWLRSEICWVKSNPLPESVRDRPGCAHEKIFQFAKSGKPLFWTHQKRGVGTRSKPTPDYYWRHRHTGEQTSQRPYRWRTLVDENEMRIWSRLNRWRGHDYYYDFAGVRTPQKPDSIERLGRARNTTAHVGPGMAPHAGIVGPRRTDKQRGHGRRHSGFNDRWDQMSREEQMATGANLRNVWWITPRPFPGNHFATFPSQLVETCVRAATSEAGCCPECGAPHERQIETRLMPTAKAARRVIVDDRDKRADPRSAGNNRQKDGLIPGWVNGVRTLGWFPTCGCDAGDPVPCVVLDPFAGSGTVGVVANEMGRDAVLCEISPEYAEMIRKRIQEDLGWFANEDGAEPSQ